MNNLKVVINATVSSPTNFKANATVNTNADFKANTKVNISNNIKAVSTGIITGTGTSDHSKLRKLTYEESGHIGFASEEELNKKANESELSRVAKTGNYNDLKGSPTNLTNLEIDNILDN